MPRRTSAHRTRLAAPARLARARGVVLIVTLVMLLVLTLGGVMLARLQTTQELLARNEHNHQLALQASEAALRNAETSLVDGVYTNFAANTNGLYTLAPASGSVADTVDWTDLAAVIGYTGPSLAGAPLSAAPRFLIESLPPVAIPGESVSAVQYGSPVPPVNVYRVTARGIGGDGTSVALTQSVVR